MKLSEVLHYYLGQRILTEDGYGSLYSVSDAGTITVKLEGTTRAPVYSPNEPELKLCLRPLSSMTEEEAVSFFSIKDPEILKYEIKRYSLTEEQQEIRFGYNGSYMSIWRMGFNFTPTEFLFLLSKSFDIFGLISSEQAIDITKLNKDAK